MVRVVVRVVIEGGAVGSTTGTTELIMNRGGHWAKSIGRANYMDKRNITYVHCNMYIHVHRNMYMYNTVEPL